MTAFEYVTARFSFVCALALTLLLARRLLYGRRSACPDTNAVALPCTSPEDALWHKIAG